MLTHPTAAQPAAVPHPSRPWRWSQWWRDVLFLHWQVPADRLRADVPPGLDLDLRDGWAWLSAVAFRLDVRRRWLPPVASCFRFFELNLRTYVRYRGEPGIVFLSMHADSRPAVRLARWCTPLPYTFARIAYTGDGVRRFCCSGGVGGAALIDAEFEPAPQERGVDAGSLDEWLLERYRAFVPDRRGRLLRMAVRHDRWTVQQTALTACSSGVGGKPMPDRWHFSTGVRALVWPFEAV